jgi:cyanophycinase-like exopeptidase
MGVEHFKRLGAQVDAVLALNRADCTDPAFAARVCAADFVYFSGGKPDYLVKTLVDTPVWRAVQAVLDRGGAVAGCSAGAMIMGSHVPSFSFGGSAFHIAGWLPGFALVPHAVIAPHYDEFPETIAKQLLTRLPPESILIGVDAHTALIGSSGRWAAMGAGRVTLHRGNRVTRYTAGQAVPVDETSG